MKIIFMGTPDFAVPSLKALLGNGLTISAVVTQPDRPRCRGQKILPSPVKKEALALGLPVYQPVKVKEEAFIRQLEELKPDIIAVVAFGQILPAGILKVPPLGCVNVHGSLLPSYRGAAPIQRAIMNGEGETGVTTMRMDTGMDTGDILLQSRTIISAEDNFGSLHDRLSHLGAKLLLKTVQLLASGKLSGTPQDDGKATYAPLIVRDDQLINWGQRAEAIRNQIRGLDPWPGARTWLDGKLVKVWSVSQLDEQNETLVAGIGMQPLPGLVLGSFQGGLAVQCGDQPLIIREMQIQGGKRLPTEELLRGFRIVSGTILRDVYAQGRHPEQPGGGI